MSLKGVSNTQTYRTRGSPARTADTWRNRGVNSSKKTGASHSSRRAQPAAPRPEARLDAGRPPVGVELSKLSEEGIYLVLAFRLPIVAFGLHLSSG